MSRRQENQNQFFFASFLRKWWLPSKKNHRIVAEGRTADYEVNSQERSLASRSNTRISMVAKLKTATHRKTLPAITGCPKKTQLMTSKNKILKAPNLGLTFGPARTPNVVTPPRGIDENVSADYVKIGIFVRIMLVLLNI